MSVNRANAKTNTGPSGPHAPNQELDTLPQNQSDTTGITFIRLKTNTILFFIREISLYIDQPIGRNNTTRKLILSDLFL